MKSTRSRIFTLAKLAAVASLITLAIFFSSMAVHAQRTPSVDEKIDQLRQRSDSEDKFREMRVKNRDEELARMQKQIDNQEILIKALDSRAQEQKERVTEIESKQTFSMPTFLSVLFLVLKNGYEFFQSKRSDSTIKLT